MALMLPVVAALFWLTTYRRIVGMPPLWNVRAQILQMNSVIDFVAPLAGAAAWMGSRESRRRVTDTVTDHPARPLGPAARHLGRHDDLGPGGCTWAASP